MKKFILLFLAVCLSLPLFAQRMGRGRINIPNLKGYTTLKCDLHLHTMFSDGVVWPTERVDEAYREGIDVICISDHLHRRANLQEIEKLANISLGNIPQSIPYDLAREYAKERGIMLIRGGEITRSAPHGHHNVLFISNEEELTGTGEVKPDPMVLFRAAKAQDAFFFWNHPGSKWWPEHTVLYEQGMMNGVEVVNGSTYYPEAHQWCLDKKLTFMGNTDAHTPIPYTPGKHRAMTLVFAQSVTQEGVREALDKRRTAIYWKDFIIGEEVYLKELFETALEWTVRKNETSVSIMVTNKSDLTFRLKKTEGAPLGYFRNATIEPFVIEPNSVLAIPVMLPEGVTGGDVSFIVENFLVEPSKGMKYTIKI